MERLSDMNPCNMCTVDRQIGNPYRWQCECDRRLKPSQWKDECVSKLAEYERLQERGRLLELPCAVGDTVYEVQKIRNRIQPLEIISVYQGRMGELYFYWELKDGFGICQNVKGFGLSELNKTVFLSREEAEKALEGKAE